MNASAPLNSQPISRDGSERLRERALRERRVLLEAMQAI